MQQLHRTPYCGIGEMAVQILALRLSIPMAQSLEHLIFIKWCSMNVVRPIHCYTAWMYVIPCPFLRAIPLTVSPLPSIQRVLKEQDYPMHGTLGTEIRVRVVQAQTTILVRVAIP